MCAHESLRVEIISPMSGRVILQSPILQSPKSTNARDPEIAGAENIKTQFSGSTLTIEPW